MKTEGGKYILILSLGKETFLSSKLITVCVWGVTLEQRFDSLFCFQHD